MRISQEEITLLKDTLYSFSKEAKLYLFGSRIDDSKKGGDIGLLVISKELNYKDIRKLRVEFFKKFWEQKIDIVLDDGSCSDSFIKIIKQKAILL